MPPRTLLSSEQRTRLFAIPSNSVEMLRHYVLGAEDLALIRTKGGRSIGSDSPSSYASSGIPASAWVRPSNRRTG